MNKVVEKWDEILQIVKTEHDLSDVSFNTWLKPLTVYEVVDNVVVARPQAKDRTYQEIESALMHLAGKHCIAGKNNDKEVSDQNN